MALMNVKNICKSYGVNPILVDISFLVEQNDKIGLIGLNGSGKTTLFEIIASKLEPDSGTVSIQRDIRLGYMRQMNANDSDKTVFEQCLSVFDHLIKSEEHLRALEKEISSNVNSDIEELLDEYGHLMDEFKAQNGYGYRSSIRGMLKGLGFNEEDFDKSCSLLSGGQKSRLSLAKLLLENPDILLLDEPTNHLDIDAINWLERFLIDYKGVVLLISHDRYFLDAVVNRILYLENKSIKSYNTNYTGFMQIRKTELALLEKQFEDQQKEIKHHEEVIKRYIQYGGERYNRQARSRQKLLDRIKVIKPHKDSKKASFRFEPSIKSGNDVLYVESLKKSYGERTLFENLNLNIYKGERVALIGANGIGKTTLFRIILGKVKEDEGFVHLGHHVYPGYFDQEMAQLHGTKTIIDEIWDAYPSLDHYQIRTYLSHFLFIGDDIFKEIDDLSGGEKARVALLKLMLSKANFLLMDEPTNHLDIDSKEVLESALNSYEGTIFVISHDRYFLNRVATKLWELTEDGIMEYLGGYDYYVEKKASIELELSEELEPQTTKTQAKLDKKKERIIQAEIRKQKKEKEALEKDIHALEEELSVIDGYLADNKTYEDPSYALELAENRKSIEQKRDELLEKWLAE